MGLLGQMTVRFGGDTMGLHGAVNDAKKIIGALANGNPLGALGLGFAAATTAAVGLGVASVKMAGDFQAGLTSLVTGAGESQKNIKLVSDGILGLATDTGTTTKQLVAGMYMIESGGYHGAAGLAILKAAAQGAKVGNADLGVVADATDTILKNFGDTGLTASQAVNTLIDTVAHGKTHMQDLSKALAQVLPTASSAKVGLNDTMAAMATMTGEGIPAANAATYLRQTILGLVAPSSGAAKALKAVGLTSSEVSDEMHKSLPGALKMITDAVGKKFPEGSAQYVAALKNISGGSKTMQGMLDLTGTHLKTFEGNVKDISSTVQKGGSSITGWALVQQNFNQQMSQAKEVVETLGIKIGTALLPFVQGLMSHIIPLMKGFADWITKGDGVKGIMGTVGNVVQSVATPVGHLVQSVMGVVQRFIAWNDKTHLVQNVLGTVGGIVQNVAGFVGGLIDKISGLVTWLTTTQGGGVALYTVLGILAVILSVNAVQAVVGFVASIPPVLAGFVSWAIGAWSVAAANIAAFWPIYLVVGAIILIIGIVILVIKNWGAIAHWLQGVWGAISGFFKGLWDKVVGAFHTVVDFFHGAIGKIGDAFSGLGKTVKGIWDGIVSAVKGAINIIIGGIDQFIGFIDGIQIHIPSIGVGPVHTPAFDWNGLGIPKIPMLAMGGMISASGWAVVGEKGPELVKLPSGANVFPNSASQQMLGSSGTSSGGQQDIYFQMDSKVLVHMVADKQARRVRLRMGRRAA